MSDTPYTFTTLLHANLDRVQQGDRAAADEVLRAVSGRLEHLAKRMLYNYPAVQRWSDVDDVIQNAMVRLLKALQTLKPQSTRDLLNLAAVQIRRELIDLSRSFNGPHGLGKRHDSVAEFAEVPVVEESESMIRDMQNWTDLHLEAAKLPDAEREVFDLLFYHGCQQHEAAEVCQVDVRTIRRRWAACLLRLRGTLANLRLE